MRRKLSMARALMVTAGFAGVALGPLRLAAQATAGDAAAKGVAQGKYLVEGVAGCGDCHTPFTDKGEPDRTKWLQGAMLGFQPIQPVPNWAKVAPPLVGMLGWNDADAIKFLMTGLDPKGKPARPPMPQFRFSKPDATAVVAYLRALKPGSK